MTSNTFKDKVVIVTGGANGIGKCIADEFRAQGAIVYVIDKQEGEHFVGDIAKKEVLEAFAEKVLSMTRQMIYHGDHGWKLEGN